MRKVFWTTFTLASLMFGITILEIRAAEINDVQAFTHLTKVQDVCQGETPRIAADGNGNLYVVFAGCKQGSKVQDIFCSSSADGGLTWTSPIDVSNTPGTSSHPDIAVEKNGAIDLVWGDTTDITSPDIFFVRSQDKGKTWTDPFNISNTPGVSAEPASPRARTTQFTSFGPILAREKTTKISITHHRLTEARPGPKIHFFQPRISAILQGNQ